MNASSTLLVCISEQDLCGNIPLYRAVLLAAKSSDLIWVRANKSAQAFPAKFTRPHSHGKRSTEEYALIVQITGPKAAVVDFVQKHKDLLDAASGSAVLLHGRFV